jgi:hypothetical protein
MDYANGKIYTIRSHQTEKYYIGSTTAPLTKRFSQHNCNYNKNKHSNIIEIFKYGDAYIELLEEFSCKNKNELNKREGELIREHKNNCVNIKIPCRPFSEYQKEWKEKNKDEIKEKRKIYLDRKKLENEINNNIHII